MSGWIKFWKDTNDDPRLLEAAQSIADKYHMATRTTFGGNDLSTGDALRFASNALRGALAALWCYADEHIRNDDTLPVTSQTLDAMIGLDGFCTMLPPDWIQIMDDGTVKLPGYCAKNQLIAKEKRRADSKTRQARYRARHASVNNGVHTHSVTSPLRVTKCVDSDSDSDSDSDQDKNKKRSIPSESHSDKSEIAIVFEHWKSVWDHPKASLDVKRSAAIKKALSGYSSADLCASISGYRNSPHHTGQNDRQTVYDDIGLLLRDAGHIDAGLRFAEKPAGLTSDLANHNVRVLQEWGESHASNGSAAVSIDDGKSRGSVRETALAAAHGALLGGVKIPGH